jgi:peptide/nickel transport system ATP-binding protein
MENLLETRSLFIRYRMRSGTVRAVQNVNLAIARGEAVGLVGESGCGKSTLAKGILGVLPRYAEVRGGVLFEGRDLASLPPADLRKVRGEEIGLIFQDPMTRLDPLMTIKDHFVELIQHHRDVGKREAVDMALKALAAVGIPPSRFRNYPHEFSGGMRQRIMIAMTLVLEPKLLIADEPTTSLDVIVEGQILQVLEDLRRRYSLALVLVTHNLGIVAETCDRVAVMYAGRIVEEGAVREIFRNPLHPYTQGLLHSVIHLETKELASIPGHPPDLVRPPPGCAFHPRCPQVFEPCSKAVPALVPVNGRPVACYLHHNVVETGPPDG